MKRTLGEKMVVSVEDAAKMVGIGKNEYYKYCREGRVPFVRIGEKRMVVPIRALEDWLNQEATKRLRA